MHHAEPLTTHHVYVWLFKIKYINTIERNASLKTWFNLVSEMKQGNILVDINVEVRFYILRYTALIHGFLP